MGHLDGHEEHGETVNLLWSCRSCNVLCANTLRRAHLGRLTRQFNPEALGAQSYQQWVLAVMAMKGEGDSDAMTVPAAVAMVKATPPEDRCR